MTWNSMLRRQEPRGWTLGLAVLGAAGMLASACAAPGSATPTRAPRAILGATPRAPAGANSVSVQDVQVSLTEFTINLGSPFLRAGRVRFDVANTGKFPHAIKIARQGIDKQTENITAGQTGVLEVDLAPGK